VQKEGVKDQLNSNFLQNEITQLCQKQNQKIKNGINGLVGLIDGGGYFI
jgi:hypothetical protein